MNGDGHWRLTVWCPHGHPQTAYLYDDGHIVRPECEACAERARRAARPSLRDRVRFRRQLARLVRQSPRTFGLGEK